MIWVMFPEGLAFYWVCSEYFPLSPSSSRGRVDKFGSSYKSLNGVTVRMEEAMLTFCTTALSPSRTYMFEYCFNGFTVL